MRKIAALGLGLSLALTPAFGLAEDKAATTAPEAAIVEATPAATPAAAPAPAPADVKFSGTVFGDYYDVAAHHDGRLSNMNGTVIRRVWLTADKDLGSGFSGRVRLEVNSADFTTSTVSTMVPYLKDAWVRWQYADKHKATLGLIESGTVGFLEKAWGLRSVEKTPLDLQGWEVTREQGLSLEGDCNVLTYALVYGNGDNNSSQGWDNGKKGALVIDSKLPMGLDLVLAGDLKEANLSGTGDPYTYTLQAFLGWKSAPARAGLLYGRQVGVAQLSNGEAVKELVSAYAVAKVWGKASAFARVDHLLWGTVDKGAQPYLGLAKQRSTLAILGLDYAITPSLNIQPNVEMAYYQLDVDGPVASQDVIPRLTFAWVF